MRRRIANIIGATVSFLWATGVSGQSLTVADVDQIVSQAVAEARAQVADDAVIAVVDRVGNVLAV